MLKRFNTIVCSLVLLTCLLVPQVFAEPRLYEIYNTIYGTSLTSDAQLQSTYGVPNDEALLETSGYVKATARYAGYTHRFGYYTDMCVGINMIELFNVTAPDGYLYRCSNSSSTCVDDGDCPGGTCDPIYEAVIFIGGGTAIIGFYDDPSGSPVWFTQSILNSDGKDHFRMYRAANYNPLNPEYLLGLEDLEGLGDADYQDLILTINHMEPYSLKCCTTSLECDDGQYCNSAETCVDHVCQAGSNPCPDDGIYCNGTEGCNEDTDQCTHSGDPCTPPLICNSDTCVNCIDDGDCDDGKYCTGVEHCVNNVCQAGSNPCPDDGIYCNGTEDCNEGTDQCTHSGDPCTPPLICNEDGDGCVSCIDDGDCDDGKYCTGVEHCVNNVCQAGSFPCNDGISCTDDICIEDGGGAGRCQSTPVDARCNDSIYCTVDACDQPGPNGCSHTPADSRCNDDKFCNGAETCNQQVGCQAGTNPCLLLHCDEENDTCYADVTLTPEPAWATPGDVGVKVDLCLDNRNFEVGGVQVDLCETIDDVPVDCLTCVGCELTERTVLFDCVVHEFEDGCCRVILFSKHPGGVINPGLCSIVKIDFTLCDQDDPECPEECNGTDCITITPTDPKISDPYGYPLVVATVAGEVCPFECGDVYPPESAPGAKDCGDGIVDIFDILAEVDFALGAGAPDACQLIRADVPNGTPPGCQDPNGVIDVFDAMVIIDMALNRQDCCSYYYTGKIY